MKRIVQNSEIIIFYILKNMFKQFSMSTKNVSFVIEIKTSNITVPCPKIILQKITRNNKEKEEKKFFYIQFTSVYI